MKRFATGLVVGKFAPLHYGHERLINAAMEQCRDLLIVSYSLPELPGCEPEKRGKWLRSRFPAADILMVTPESARLAGVTPMPANDADDESHRRFVAELCLKVFRKTVDAVFTAEDYGDGFAAVLQREFSVYAGYKKRVEHVRLDRNEPPQISGTMLRAHVHECRNWLAPCVYADFVRRICILGGESSGKSTLAAALAAALGAPHVAEYGRELWEERSGRLVFEDMLHIAREQIRREEAACAGPDLVCDTSPLTTLFYSLSMFGRADPLLGEMAERQYDVRVLCAPDFPFVQDGTRQGDAFRREQHRWYQEQLAARAIKYVEARGSIEQRIECILLHLGTSPGIPSRPR